ncbi:MAG: Coenzyme F420 hydrogenase/dehydrogenase, beta subunit C-terminal domain [Desulfatibacillaceae bacterium]
MNLFGPNELMEDVIRQGLCVGCGACVGMCPYFSTYRGKTAQLFACTSSQGRCFAYCPKIEVDLDELSNACYGEPYDDSPIGRYREVVAAKAGPEAPNVPYQTGGTVTALLAWAMEAGLLDGAVVTKREGLVPTPELVTDADGVCSAAGSKYMASPTVSALNEAARDGYRNLGVVATPCQATAIAQMRGNPLNREDFTDPVGLLVGLFCTWALDTRGLMSLLEDRVDVSGITGMDIPPPPAEVLVLKMDDGGAVEIPLVDVREYIPQGCGVCCDMTAEWADVSVGAVEGMPGYNSLVIRTEKGAEMVGGARKAGFLDVEEMPQQYLDGLFTAAGNKKKRALAQAKTLGLLNTAEEGKRAAYRLSEEIVNRLLGA